ncbi:probable xyloglucan endotransglucosylase/hydrolase protein 27 [Phoenix dactylifera]|uniref:Xyloglucan endotransglucosylase/hydrolase n=1 Tax=Phoenix dactylifera TaxID=42345 RepID=A0A8B7CFX9_PHODC|nr:probable xyloglucan endotransglucosylase/hydrolase protein 27 [Phoenix dactylifera]
MASSRFFFFSSLLLLASFLSLFLLSHGAISSFPNLTSLSFEEGYTQLFGDSNLMLHRDGRGVHLSLDERTGAGFASQDLYLHGFFSAAIKLPSDYAAGVVVAFYMSNGDVFERTHDELDFEFLGNIRGKEWRVQTNIYGNGSTAIGREERYGLWFDPTEDFHKYSILWSHDRIIFYIDNVPIREVARTEVLGGQFPSKPMSLYATIWDGSNWATSGGRYKINYKYAPYIAEFADLILDGCAVDPMDHTPTCNGLVADLYDTITISTDQRLAMERFRKKHMTYSYCYDRIRYSTPLPECSAGPEARQFQESGEVVRFGDRRRRGKRHHHAPTNSAI